MVRSHRIRKAPFSFPPSTALFFSARRKEKGGGDPPPPMGGRTSSGREPPEPSGRRKKKCSRPAVMGREHRNLYTSWCHPPSPPPRNVPPGRSLSGPMERGAGRGVSARARGLSSPGPPAPLAAQGRCSLFGGWAGYSCPVIAPSILYCMCFWGKCQGPYFSRRFLLLTMFRQSMSPRSMPSTSISAVATLEAKGMLFWSHRRVI